MPCFWNLCQVLPEVASLPSPGSCWKPEVCSGLMALPSWQPCPNPWPPDLCRGMALTFGRVLTFLSQISWFPHHYATPHPISSSSNVDICNHSVSCVGSLHYLSLTCLCIVLMLKASLHQSPSWSVMLCVWRVALWWHCWSWKYNQLFGIWWLTAREACLVLIQYFSPIVVPNSAQFLDQDAAPQMLKRYPFIKCPSSQNLT